MMRIAFALLAAISICASARADDPIKIPFSVVQAAFKKAKCTIELQDEERTEVEDLGGGLKIVEIYCRRAAYQAGSIFLAVDRKAPAKARLLLFNEWDSEKKRLITVYWKWTGRDFMLTRFFSKPNCNGQPFDDDRKWQVYPPR